MKTHLRTKKHMGPESNHTIIAWAMIPGDDGETSRQKKKGTKYRISMCFHGHTENVGNQLKLQKSARIIPTCGFKQGK